MVENVRPKLSTIVKELAESVFRDPRAVPTTAAAHLALLIVHVAWNRAVGQPLPEAQYRPMLEVLEQTNPKLWDELADSNVERMIDRVDALKRARYPQDHRVIQVCGMRDGNVHVEWYEGRKLREADAIATQHLVRLLELVMSGDDAEAVRHLCHTAGISPEESHRQIGKLRKVLRGPRP